MLIRIRMIEDRLFCWVSLRATRLTIALRAKYANGRSVLERSVYALLRLGSARLQNAPTHRGREPLN